MSDKPRKKIYLAGDMIFRKDGETIFKRMKAICNKHGIDGLGPWDGQKHLEGLPPETPDLAKKITQADEDLMKKADGAIFCIDGARGGADMDAGTAFEVGFMVPMGKPLAGFTGDPRTYSERVADMFGGKLVEREVNEEGATSGSKEDPNGVMVHSDGLVQNAMVIEGIKRCGGQTYPDDDFFKGFEKSVVDIKKTFDKLDSKQAEPYKMPDKEDHVVGDTNKKRVYLAGDMIFRKDGEQALKRMKAICNKYGFEGLAPWDGQKHLEGLPPNTPNMAQKITEADESLMRQSDGAIFCLDGARGGADMDAGTAYEVGYMSKLGGKKLSGFTGDPRTYSERVSDMFGGKLIEREVNEEGATSGSKEDPNGVMVHSDGLVQNAMIVEGIRRRGGEVYADKNFFKAFEKSAKNMAKQLGLTKDKKNIKTAALAKIKQATR